MIMDWSWATAGVTDEVPRTTGPECINYMTNRRRWIETVFFTIFFILVIRWAVRRLDPIIVPPSQETQKPHSAVRMILLIAITLIFGIEMGFKFANKSVIFVLNPCHIQTMMQIYLLAAKPNKTTIALFRIQMNNLNGPLLAFLFPEVESRLLPFEQATYWIQHALLYIIPVYILKSGAYEMEDFKDYNWATIGVAVMLLYHFVVLNTISIYTGINLNHMLCAAVADPFQGQNYRIAAVIHESLLCPILNKVSVLIFCSVTSRTRKMPLEMRISNRLNPTEELDGMLYHQHQLTHKHPHAPTHESLQQGALYTPLEEMSLAAEMAAVANDKLNANNLTHRLSRVEAEAAYLEEELLLEKAAAASAAAATAAEYTMPTTKID